jgi:hypothetical protein
MVHGYRFKRAEDRQSKVKSQRRKEFKGPKSSRGSKVKGLRPRTKTNENIE